MLGGEEFGHHLNRLPHLFTISPRGIHGEDFHPFLNLILAGRKELPLTFASPSLLTVNLHQAQTTNRNRGHVQLVTQYWEGNLLFVANLLYIQLPRGVIDGCPPRSSSPFEIDDNVSIRILERLGCWNRHRRPIDLESDILSVICLRRRIQSD